MRGSAIEALEGKNTEYGTQAIESLMQALDTKLDFPERPIDKPFLMSVDHCINIGVRRILNLGKRTRCNWDCRARGLQG